MSPEFHEKLKQVVKYHPEILDENGHIIPSEAVRAKINAANPDPGTDGERAALWRDMQAQTVLDLWERLAN